MGQRNGQNQGSRAGDKVLPWIRSNISWIAPGAVVAGVALHTWFKTDFAVSVINPQSMLEFREKSVKRECRAAVTECFAQPGLGPIQLWSCLDSRVGK